MQRLNEPDTAGLAGGGSTVIEVFADIVCPFTHVGLRRFVARRDQLGRNDVKLRVRSWPLELVNGVPLAADFVAEEIEELRAAVAPELFVGFSPATFPTTSLPALGLAATAAAVSPEAGEAMSLALRDALFEQGLDVSRTDVLASLAARNGVPFDGPATGRQSVLDDLEDGRARGVIGSPHFFTPHGDFFCPALEVSRDADGHLHVTPSPATFDDFVDAALAPTV